MSASMIQSLGEEPMADGGVEVILHPWTLQVPQTSGLVFHVARLTTTVTVIDAGTSHA
jgi:hypothetical protein